MLLLQIKDHKFLYNNDLVYSVAFTTGVGSLINKWKIKSK